MFILYFWEAKWFKTNQGPPVGLQCANACTLVFATRANKKYQHLTTAGGTMCSVCLYQLCCTVHYWPVYQLIAKPVVFGFMYWSTLYSYEMLHFSLCIIFEIQQNVINSSRSTAVSRKRKHILVLFLCYISLRACIHKFGKFGVSLCFWGGRKEVIRKDNLYN